MSSRREFLGAGGRVLAGLALAPWIASPGTGGSAAPLRRPRPARTVEIRMRSDPTGARVWFDPIGLRVEPGTTVRWVLEANVHSTTAYHPANGGFASRIPAGADPWDSGMLVEPGSAFERRLDVPGVYDYYCVPHERAGMAGRIVVAPSGEATAHREPAPASGGFEPPSPAALAALPPVERILREGVIRP